MQVILTLIHIQIMLNQYSVPVMIYVLVGVICAERFIDGRALVHELYGASCVSRDVTDRQQPADRQRERQTRRSLCKYN